MKLRAQALLLLLGVAAVCAHAQFTPPPVAGFVNPGSGWTPLTGNGDGTAVTFNPPPAAIYTCATVVSGVCTSWEPWTGAGGGGGDGTVISVTFTGDGTILSSTPSSPVTTSGTLTATLATQTANTVLGALTATTPSDLALPSCSAAADALIWTSGTGFGCNTSITANAVPAANLTGTTLASNVVSSSLTSAAGGSFGTAAYDNTGTSGANIPLLNGANTYSGATIFSANGAASTPGLSTTGTCFVGTGTTSTPCLYINSGSSQPTGWSTSTGGTTFGINAVSGFAGNFLDFHINGGSSLINMTSSGAINSGSMSASTSIQAGGGPNFFASGSQVSFSSTQPVAWTSSSSATGTKDTVLGREKAGWVEVNSGAGVGTGGVLDAAVYSSSGTKFTATGCTTISSTTGGASAGKFTIGGNSCTVVITINGATGLTANNGYSCYANDETTAAGNTGLYFSTNSATTATLTVPSGAAASDVIDFGCMAY